MTEVHTMNGKISKAPMMNEDHNSRDFLTLSLPHLTDDERTTIVTYLQRPEVAEALAELSTTCECIAGSIFCTCDARGSLSTEHEQLLAPLVVAYSKGVQVSAPQL